MSTAPMSDLRTIDWTGLLFVAYATYAISLALVVVWIAVRIVGRDSKPHNPLDRDPN